MTLQVRAMQQGDIDNVYAIELVGHRAPWGRDILSDCVSVGYDCRILEVVEGADVELTGYIICRYHETTCHVLNLCVSPTLHRKGYGQFLLQNMINVPGRPSIDTMRLEVRPSNLAALSLYKKLGFQQVGIKRGYYRSELNDAQKIEDAIVLQKQIIHQS
jgi:ribosomal-protein-alanine N-acetyltransferase